MSDFGDADLGGDNDMLGDLGAPDNDASGMNQHNDND